MTVILERHTLGLYDQCQIGDFQVAFCFTLGFALKQLWNATRNSPITFIDMLRWVLLILSFVFSSSSRNFNVRISLYYLNACNVCVAW